MRSALEAALAALKLARREAEGGEPRWVALGIVSALQGALVAALSGYETAGRGDVLNPVQTDRIAPVALLLRRAGSAQFLNPPEQVGFSASQLRAVERVMAVRNEAVHALSVTIPDTFAADSRMAIRLITHLVLDAPAFNPDGLRILTVFLQGELAALSQALERITLA